jgi:hypothetical protein
LGKWRAGTPAILMLQKQFTFFLFLAIGTVIVVVVGSSDSRNECEKMALQEDCWRLTQWATAMSRYEIEKQLIAENGLLLLQEPPNDDIDRNIVTGLRSAVLQALYSYRQVRHITSCQRIWVRHLQGRAHFSASHLTIPGEGVDFKDFVANGQKKAHCVRGRLMQAVYEQLVWLAPGQAVPFGAYLREHLTWMSSLAELRLDLECNVRPQEACIVLGQRQELLSKVMQRSLNFMQELHLLLMVFSAWAYQASYYGEHGDFDWTRDRAFVSASMDKLGQLERGLQEPQGSDGWLAWLLVTMASYDRSRCTHHSQKQGMVTTRADPCLADAFKLACGLLQRRENG